MPSNDDRNDASRRRRSGSSTPPRQRRQPTDATYEVGYGKPPREGQFKPGHSGNPNGRRPGAKGVRARIQEMLDRKIAGPNGAKVRLSDAILQRAVAMLASKDNRSPKAAMDVIRFLEEFDHQETYRPRASDLTRLKRVIGRLPNLDLPDGVDDDED